jgi:hypothetical protein
MCTEHTEQNNAAEKRKIALPVAKCSRERIDEHTAKRQKHAQRDAKTARVQQKRHPHPFHGSC